MKKIIFIFTGVLILFFGIFADAQGFISTIDVKLGSNLANQRLKYPNGDTRTFDSKSGSAFSVAVDFDVLNYDPESSFRTQVFLEIGQVTRGMKDKYHYYVTPTQRVTDYYDNSVSYFSLLPQLRFTLTYKRVFLFGYLGPRFDFLMGSDLESLYEELFLTTDGTRYITWESLYDNLNSNVLGFSVGGGWGILFGQEKRVRVFTEIRVDRDFTPASEDVLELYNTTNWIFYFGIGYVL